MTAYCSGGTSSQRAEFAEVLYIGPAAAGALLNNIRTRWAVPLAALIGAATYRLSVFCATDPPPMPTITTDDVASLLNPLFDPVQFLTARQKFQDLIGALLWPTVCQCDTTTTAPAVGPVDPGGWSVTPHVGDPGTAQPCYEFAEKIMTPYLTSFPLPIQTKIHQGETLVAMEIWQADGGGPHGTMTWQLYWQDADFTTIHLETAQPFPFQTTHVTAYYPWFSGAEYVLARWNSAAQPTSHDTGHAIMRLYCGTNPNNLPAPCGPPDFTLQPQLDSLLALVTLIQRQVAPFAYIAGTEHAGLTGNGSISVQGLIGARLELEMWCTSVGEESGDPNVIFDAGWVNWGNADGVTPREHLVAEQQVSFPPAAGQFTSIHYSLGQDVSLRITELVREP